MDRVKTYVCHSFTDRHYVPSLCLPEKIKLTKKQLPKYLEEKKMTRVQVASQGSAQAQGSHGRFGPPWEPVVLP